MFSFTAEQENYITVKPGQAVDNYNVVIKIEIFDIFIDFMECFVDIGYVSILLLLLICADMVFNATFINTSIISWRSVIFVEETGVPGEIHRPAASH